LFDSLNILIEDNNIFSFRVLGHWYKKLTVCKNYRSMTQK